MIDFFKRLYLEAYDLPNFYLGIENELYCHVFTAFFILALFLSFIYIGRLAIGSKKERMEKRELKRKMEKSILEALEEKNKNKENI